MISWFGVYQYTIQVDKQSSLFEEGAETEYECWDKWLTQKTGGECSLPCSWSGGCWGAHRPPWGCRWGTEQDATSLGHSDHVSPPGGRKPTSGYQQKQTAVKWVFCKLQTVCLQREYLTVLGLCQHEWLNVPLAWLFQRNTIRRKMSKHNHGAETVTKQRHLCLRPFTEQTLVFNAPSVSAFVSSYKPCGSLSPSASSSYLITPLLLNTS